MLHRSAFVCHCLSLVASLSHYLPVSLPVSLSAYRLSSCLSLTTQPQVQYRRSIIALQSSPARKQMENTNYSDIALVARQVEYLMMCVLLSHCLAVCTIYNLVVSLSDLISGRARWMGQAHTTRRRCASEEEACSVCVARFWQRECCGAIRNNSEANLESCRGMCIRVAGCASGLLGEYQGCWVSIRVAG